MVAAGAERSMRGFMARLDERTAARRVSALSVARPARVGAIMRAAEDTMSSKALSGRVAVVAGATRGAGRGIARGLAEAGALVYCTGRSVRGRPSPYQRPETIDETAAMIRAAGGTAIPVRVDHTGDHEIEALF